MGYKKMDRSFGFADLALESSLKHNRSLKTMQKLDKAINWSRVKEIWFFSNLVVESLVYFQRKVP